MTGGPVRAGLPLAGLWLGCGLLGCTASPTSGDTGAPAAALPTLGPLVQVVPGPGLPLDLVPQDSNNNLDVTWHDGAAFLAFRTAPSHFASEDTQLHVLRSTDQQTWQLELSVHMDTDLREPRLLSWDGALYFYFAVLGASSTAFEPQGTMLAVRGPDGAWTGPDWWRTDSFIPWRIHVLDGVPQMTGYTGGDEIYDLPEGAYPQLEVSWLATEDGRTWDAAVPGQPVVWTGGASETDLAFAPDGAVIAVMRNEAGDAEGFGSLVCRGEPDALADWRCERDDRKFDSPLVFAHGDRIWLVGRRNVTESGAYDLGYDDMDFQQQSLAYQVDYWNQPKRCALWEVDPDALTVAWVLDLPSNGDTCFASVLPEDDGGYTIYNYSNDPDGPELSWLEGQLGQTNIYAQRLWLPD